MANCIDTNNRHYPKEIIDKTIMETSLDKVADFMLDTNTVENHKRSFPSFTQSLFDEQKLRNSIM